MEKGDGPGQLSKCLQEIKLCTQNFVIEKYCELGQATTKVIEIKMSSAIFQIQKFLFLYVLDHKYNVIQAQLFYIYKMFLLYKTDTIFEIKGS